jgi:hypothetical protein
MFYQENGNNDLVLKKNIQLLDISSSLSLVGFTVHHSNDIQRIYRIKNDIFME